MKLKEYEKEEFCKYSKELLNDKQVQKMQEYIQHGNTTTWMHVLRVSYYSYWVSMRLHLKVDKASLVRGAILHDFYLYDWHIPHESHRLHGFGHPEKALENGRKHFKLNCIEEDVIAKHMWPLTLTKVPRYKESMVVCFVDKICSTFETIKFTKNIPISMDILS